MSLVTSCVTSASPNQAWSCRAAASRPARSRNAFSFGTTAVKRASSVKHAARPSQSCLTIDSTNRRPSSTPWSVVAPIPIGSVDASGIDRPDLHGQALEDAHPDLWMVLHELVELAMARDEHARRLRSRD